MGHHAHYVAVEVTNAGDVRASTVWVRFGGNIPVFVAIAKDDLAVFFELLKSGIVASIVPFGVSDRYRKDSRWIDLGGEGRIRVFDAEIYVFADEMETCISH